MEEIIHSRSIADVYNFINAGKPPHPLITVIRKWPETKQNLTPLKFTSDLYYIAMKRDIRGSFQYGRNAYDYREGAMIFMSPGQVATFNAPQAQSESDNWTILFHPDLIRKSELGKKITEYSFFSYDTSEALHLSDKERGFLNTLVDTIEQEIH
ncbi:MAG: AraC family transcriptional regulator, partial [Bacteroidota bacterium]